MSSLSARAAATPSGLAVDPLYEVSDPALAARLGRPGEYPFTRGIHPTMYRGRLWTMRQYAGFGSARETNRRFRYLLDQGQTGLSVAFDLPTQIGHDSDHPLAAGEVGKVGVAINTLADLETLLDGIPLGKVSVSMTINATASILLAMLVVLGRRQGVAKGELRGTVQNDILKEYAARGTFRFPVEPSLRLVGDVIEWCVREAPAFHPISISGYHMREAGCTAIQEVGFTLANGIAYVGAARARGLEVDRIGERLSFFFNAHNHLFEEVAKFRAARRLWARIMRERFGAASAAATSLRFHTQTAGSTLASRQVDTNVVRVAVQALAAVLGGTQSLHTNSKDEALSLPTEEAARLALRTQQVLAHESGVADTADPLGGSAFVESLTDAIEAGAAALIEEIDRRGGAVAAIESGFVQREIHRSALEWQRAVESGARVVVGVNRYEADEPPPALFRVNEHARAEVLRALEAARAARDAGRVRRALDRVARAAREGRNAMEGIVAAVEAYASVGEICGALEGVFGRYRAPAVL